MDMQDRTVSSYQSLRMFIIPNNLFPLSLAPHMLPCAAMCNSYFADVLEVLTSAKAFHKSLLEQKVLLAQVPPTRSACSKAHRCVQRKVSALIREQEE